MKRAWLLLLAVATGCSPAVPEPNELPVPPLSTDVRIIPKENMFQWCHALEQQPGRACKDYYLAPAEEVARFDQRLPELLSSHGLARIAPAISGYLRQYWGVSNQGFMLIVGRFTCRNRLLNQVDPETGAATPFTADDEWFPIELDDAGDCVVTATYPLGYPERLMVHPGAF